MSIQDRLNRETEVAKLEAGESVVGTLLDLALRDSDYGDPYPVVTIETADGREVDVHGYHSVLRNRLLELDPRPGDQLGIKSLGKRTSKSGSTYNDYRVVLERADRPAGEVHEPKVTPARPPLPSEVVALDVSALRPPAVPTYEDEEAF
jgi:hypothetical protein